MVHVDLVKSVTFPRMHQLACSEPQYFLKRSSSTQINKYVVRSKEARKHSAAFNIYIKNLMFL